MNAQVDTQQLFHARIAEAGGVIERGDAVRVETGETGMQDERFQLEIRQVRHADG